MANTVRKVNTIFRYSGPKIPRFLQSPAKSGLQIMRFGIPDIFANPLSDILLLISEDIYYIPSQRA